MKLVDLSPLRLLLLTHAVQRPARTRVGHDDVVGQLGGRNVSGGVLPANSL